MQPRRAVWRLRQRSKKIQSEFLQERDCVSDVLGQHPTQFRIVVDAHRGANAIEILRVCLRRILHAGALLCRRAGCHNGTDRERRCTAELFGLFQQHDLEPAACRLHSGRQS
jgi:hypothetical protein